MEREKQVKVSLYLLLHFFQMGKEHFLSRRGDRGRWEKGDRAAKYCRDKSSKRRFIYVEILVVLILLFTI